MPKVLYGHNIIDLEEDEVQSAIWRLLNEVGKGLGDESLNQRSWSVRRVDWCYTWRVDNPAAYLIDMFPAIHVRKDHRHILWASKTHDYTLRQGPQRDWSAMMYDKEAEVAASLGRDRNRDLGNWTEENLIEISRGALRFELTERTPRLKQTLPNGRSLESLLQFVHKGARAHVCERYHELIGSKWTPTSYARAVSKLLALYPPGKARHLADFYKHASDIGVEAYRELFQIETQTLRRLLKDLRAAGVTPSSNGTLKPLSPISSRYGIDPLKKRIRTRPRLLG